MTNRSLAPARGVLGVMVIATTACIACTSMESPPGCIPGMASACACPDGRAGAQSCLPDGTFGPCECTGSGEDGGSARDAGAPAIVRTAPSGDTVRVRDTISLQFDVRGSVDRVELLLDGAPLATLSPPYAFTWDTRAHREGPHLVVGRGVLGAGAVESAPLTVIVDRTSPHVIGRMPAPDETDAWLAEPITITFDEPLLATTVNESFVAISAGAAVGLDKTVSLSADGTTVTVELETVPVLPATFRIDVTATATDFAGNAVIADSWSFVAPEWPRVGGTADVPSSVVPNGQYAMATDDAGRHPCVAWVQPPSIDDQYDLVVSCFDGAMWNRVGGSLNVDRSASVSTGSIDVDSMSRPVVAWTESTTIDVVHVARWSGSAWESLMAETVSSPQPTPRMMIDSAGALVTAWRGVDGVIVRRWNGSAWSDVTTALSVVGFSLDMTLDRLDRPVVGTTGTGCHVWAWDGATWAERGDRVATEPEMECRSLDLAVGSDGNPIAVVSMWSSTYTPYSRVFRWIDSRWEGEFSSSRFRATNGNIRITDADELIYWYVLASPAAVIVERGTASAWTQIGEFASGREPQLDLVEGRSPMLMIARGSDIEVYRRNGR